MMLDPCSPTDRLARFFFSTSGFFTKTETLALLLTLTLVVNPLLSFLCSTTTEASLKRLSLLRLRLAYVMKRVLRLHTWCCCHACQRCRGWRCWSTPWRRPSWMSLFWILRFRSGGTRLLFRLVYVRRGCCSWRGCFGRYRRLRVIRRWSCCAWPGFDGTRSDSSCSRLRILPWLDCPNGRLSWGGLGLTWGWRSQEPCWCWVHRRNSIFYLYVQWLRDRGVPWDSCWIWSWSRGLFHWVGWTRIWLNLKLRLSLWWCWLLPWHWRCCWLPWRSLSLWPVCRGRSGRLWLSRADVGSRSRVKPCDYYCI